MDTTIITENTQSINENLNRRVLAMADKAMELLRSFGCEQVSSEQLVAALPELAAKTTLAQYWEQLTMEPSLAACFEVLQLLGTLETEVAYQVQRYGPTSLHEDFRELKLAVARLQKAVQNGN